MVCPFCEAETEVTNSRRQKKSNQVWRRRRCTRCRAVFTTHEVVYFPAVLAVQRSTGRKEPFLTDKLYAEVLMAVADRKDCYEAARALTTTIIRNLQKNPQKPLYEPQTISLEAAKVLKRFDRRAWLRFMAEHPSLQA